jgi:hypothetical protein
MDQVEGEPGFLELIKSYTQNIRSLQFSGFTTIKELTQTLPNFPQALSNLQSLTLAGHGHADRKHPVDPFKSLAPTLRSLSLTRIHLYPSFLRLRALTELTLHDREFNLHLDTQLDFLEETRSLKSVTLDVLFKDPSLRRSRRVAAIENQFQHLSISLVNGGDGKALISNIALRRGAHLELVSYEGGPLKDVLSGSPTAQLLNLPSPIFMEYRHEDHDRSLRLLGPNGSFSIGNPTAATAFSQSSLYFLSPTSESFAS